MPPQSVSSSALPLIFSRPDNTHIIGAVVDELDHYTTDRHYLRVLVTLGFCKQRNNAFGGLMYEIGKALAEDNSGYRVYDYELKHKTTNVYQLTLLCRFIDLKDLAA